VEEVAASITVEITDVPGAGLHAVARAGLLEAEALEGAIGLTVPTLAPVAAAGVEEVAASITVEITDVPRAGLHAVSRASAQEGLTDKRAVCLTEPKLAPITAAGVEEIAAPVAIEIANVPSAGLHAIAGAATKEATPLEGPVAFAVPTLAPVAAARVKEVAYSVPVEVATKAY
jgi:hypothetical protein